jgi:DNA-3-methyladenine glycosylase II
MKPTQPWVKPEYWDQAKRHLSQHDRVLRPVIETFKHEQLRSRGNAFETLARAIVGQQISVKAAESIWKKLESALGEVAPEIVQQTENEALRSLGLSSQKVLYLNTIAEGFLIGKLNPQSWHNATDEHIIKELTAVKGIGRWTAEMFLIFYLMKPDILPLADIGLQKAIEKLYNQGNKLTLQEMNGIAEPWRPYRTVATWYLWRSLDPVPVEY